MNLTPKGYLPRLVDAQVERYLRAFGAVEIAGTRWCGKTWTSLAHGATVTRLDDDSDRAAAEADPALALLGETPHVIDEWQRVPKTWDAVRQRIDEERRLRGLWILTGSSTPAARQPFHSGAGRIGTVRMLPMSLQESGESSADVSLSGLFAGEFTPCKAPKDTRALADLVCRGGWPEAVGDEPDTAQLVAREYLRLFYDVSAPREGKSPDLTERLVISVARTLGQATKHATYQKDMFGDNEGIDDETLSSYLSMLRRQYMVNEVRGWVPPARSPRRLRVKPKRYLADPSLAVAALGMSPAALLGDWQTFGTVFESMAMRDLEVYARVHRDAGTVPVRYYRDDAGLEVDAIVELADGRWAAFEIKLSDDKVDEAIANLRRLRRKLCENSAARTRPPEFMAVVVGISEYARELEKGIYSIPLRAFGA